MRRNVRVVTAGLTLALFAVSLPDGRGQRPAAMPYPGAAGPRPGGVGPVPYGAGPAGGAGYAPFGGSPIGGAGLAPFVGVYGGYQGFNSNSGPGPASVPSAAYFTYGRTSYTTESPSPIPVYSPVPAYAPLPPAMPLTSLLQVQVPPDTEVWLEGHKMRSAGAVRHFRSPPLDPAKGYVYEVRARRTVEGHAVEDVRHVAIRAGATVLVDFTNLAAFTPPSKDKKPQDSADDASPPPAAPPANTR